MEKWIIGYEENYTVTEDGKVFSVKFGKRKEMKQCLTKGYWRLGLKKDGKNKNFRVNRLVAEAFLPNPENKEQVNHIDGNKQNNNLVNLEWSTPSENTQHAVDTGLLTYEWLERPVLMFNLTSEVIIQEYKSLTEAGNITGICVPNIHRVCNGSRTKAGGYGWKYKEGRGGE